MVHVMLLPAVTLDRDSPSFLLWLIAEEGVQDLVQRVLPDTRGVVRLLHVVVLRP